MPTKRFSTRSTRPMPCSPPSRFSRVRSAAGPSRSPSTATGSPRSNAISSVRGTSGAASGSLVSWNILAGGSAHGASSTPPPYEMWKRVRAGLYGRPTLGPRDGDVVPPRELDERRAGVELPFPPRRDHAQVRRQGRVGQLEADLVVALAGRAVGDGVGALLRRDLHLRPGDERARDRRAQEIGALVHGVGPEHREDEAADELLA